MIHELQHPLAKHLVNRLRCTDIDATQFKGIVAELSRILMYRALSSIPLSKSRIKTWKGDADYSFINQQNLILVPILRAGIPMLDGLNTLLPEAASAFMAMKRDEVTHVAKLYYDRIPNCTGKTVIVLDPMLATGGSLTDAISLIKQRNPAKVLSLNIIGAPEGVQHVQDMHPDTDIFIAQIDECLDDHKFIYPGLGDAGDRAFNTPE